MNQRAFGTAPVFFTAISTILGAIMFLRFGFAVGHVGLLGTFLIILLGHAVTIPTAMAIAEIATNQRVEGGGEYYIISRTFGVVIGSSIGLALYLSQAISVAFYIMAFTEAFNPALDWLSTHVDLPGWLEWMLRQKQTIGIPALLVLTWIMLTKGASLGVKALYVVVFTLALSLVAFFIGKTEYAETHQIELLRTIYQTEEPVASISYRMSDSASLAVFQHPFQEDTPTPAVQPAAPVPGQDRNRDRLGFFLVFAIIFPAFTGMTAGVGLSGDLKNPGKAIPLGTLGATITGMVVYMFIAWKLAESASPADLANTDQLVMSSIAWQGWWLIPLGLAAATISSALGSIMVAPRTLQAIARDHVLPQPRVNRWLSMGRSPNDEPFNATLVTIVIAGAFILLGALDAVAEVISMFFMVTYGTLCLISFLQHFAADPSYRPRFRSRWYLSLFGAIACFALMFAINAGYALMAIVAMIMAYWILDWRNPDKKSMAVLFQGVIYQLSRRLQVFLQSAKKEQTLSWRPSAICLSEHSFDRPGAFDLLRWISQRYGFGTYIHHIPGYLSRNTHLAAESDKQRLIEHAEKSGSRIYVDTMVGASFSSAISSVIQLPGIAGADNNLILFEFAKHDPEELGVLMENFKLIHAVNFDILLLGSCERGFGLHQEIHLWITGSDTENSTLMILLAYIIAGHRDWKRSRITIYAIAPVDRVNEEKILLSKLIHDGQLPISEHNLKVIARPEDTDTRGLINQTSKDADLTLIGFREEAVRRKGVNLFSDYDLLGNVLFVGAAEGKEIK